MDFHIIQNYTQLIDELEAYNGELMVEDDKFICIMNRDPEPIYSPAFPTAQEARDWLSEFVDTHLLAYAYSAMQSSEIHDPGMDEIIIEARFGRLSRMLADWKATHPD